MRAADGLALSSRNAYLTEAERKIAPILNQTLRDVAAAVAAGGAVADAEGAALMRLKAAGFGPIDYVEVRGAVDLARLGPGATNAPARVMAAAWLGKTRLIDNIAV